MTGGPRLNRAPGPPGGAGTTHADGTGARRPHSFHDRHPEPDRFHDDVIAGLSRPQKSLPPKYFYDVRGCASVRGDLRLAGVLPRRALRSS